MARVEFARTALDELDLLCLTFSLPSDTRARVARSLRSLERFPRLGPPLPGRWDGLRFVLGPWRWMLLVYEYLDAEDLVVVVSVQDVRSSEAISIHRARR